MAVAAVPAASKRSCLGNGFDKFRNCVVNTEGAAKAVDFSVAIFSAVAQRRGGMPSSLTNLDTSFRTFYGISTLASIARKFSDWTNPDASGKMIWQQSKMSIAFHVSLTCYYIFSFISFAARKGIVVLGKALPVVKVLTDVFSFCAGASDMYNTVAVGIPKAKATRIKARNNTVIWSQINRMIQNQGLAAWKTTCEVNYKKWEQRSAAPAGKSAQEIKAKMIFWSKMENCSEQEAKDFVKDKVTKWSIISRNAKIDYLNGVFGIVFDIAVIAISIFSFFAIGGWAFIIAHLAVSSIEWSMFVGNVIFTREKVVEAATPNSVLLSV